MSGQHSVIAMPRRLIGVDLVHHVIIELHSFDDLLASRYG
jgi:hypothetical protein